MSFLTSPPVPKVGNSHFFSGHLPAGSHRKRRSAEIRASEQSRQWDRQREDIHPAEVIERLASVQAKKPAVSTLPPAVPDADPDRPVRALPIRTFREEPLP
jgi:hypothetical protein